jgi:hypothetical protein
VYEPVVAQCRRNESILRALFRIIICLDYVLIYFNLSIYLK